MYVTNPALSGILCIELRRDMREIVTSMPSVFNSSLQLTAKSNIKWKHCFYLQMEINAEMSFFIETDLKSTKVYYSEDVL